MVDNFVPVTPNVAAEFGKNSRTIKRWIADPALRFPRPVRINNRLYVRRGELDSWKAERTAGAVH